MDPVPDYDDLIWLFEAEPTYPYAADEAAAGYEFGWRELWPYTYVIFRTERAGLGIEMHLKPGQRTVRLRLSRAGAELVDLELGNVQSAGVERIHGRELLRLDFPESAAAETLWLRFKPDVVLTWSVAPP